jgi:crotonobetaine/carnitine-CoA ligase
VSLTFSDRKRWTLPDVLRERAATHADHVYLEVPQANESYTFSQTLAIAERIAAGLVRRGGKFGDRVLIMAPNCSAYILTWFGANLGGMVEVPINNAYRGTFLEHQVKTTAPKFAVVHPEFVDRFIDSIEACRSIERFFILGSADIATSAIEILSAAGQMAEPFGVLLDAEPVELPPVRPSDLANIFFTSGTTGLSKGVMMPFSQVYFFADELVSLTRLTETDTYMAVGPLFHGNCTFLAAYPALIAGARFVLYEKFSASRWAEWLHDSGATVTNFIGVMMDFVWKQPPSPSDADNQLRCIFAAPTASSIMNAFKQRFGVDAFVEVFGLTETCMPILTPYGTDRPAGACGLHVADYFDIRLVDPETDDEVPDGQVGELIVRSKLPWTSCLGYYGMPEKTLETFRNLWFHTGDGLRRDAEGWYYFVDRLKDALRRRGENISSYEVEQAILEHPAVFECAVIGVPADSEGGEDEVMLFAVPAPNSDLHVEELWAFAEKRLPAFTVPRYIKIMDSLPKTPSEKVQKGELRKIAATSDRYDRLLIGR